MIEKEKLTKEEAIRRHRELWNKIAELIEDKDPEIIDEISFTWGIGMIKRIALKKLGYNPDIIDSYCWCCEYANGVGGCLTKCPIDWRAGNKIFKTCICIGSPYKKFESAVWDNDYENAIQYAREVANLPERK